MSKLLKGVGWTVGTLGVVALLLRATVFKVWTLPDDDRLSASVGPSLGAGDTVLVLTQGTPAFGDLVRCTDPEDPTHFIVARIVGLDGDTVDAHDSFLAVNNTRYDGKQACPEPTFAVIAPTNHEEVQLRCDEVPMGGGWHYRGVRSGHPADLPTQVVVKTGMLFLLSDDREFHDDSRDFGTLPKTSCTERIVFRLWGKNGWMDSKHRLVVIH